MAPLGKQTLLFSHLAAAAGGAAITVLYIQIFAEECFQSGYQMSAECLQSTESTCSDWLPPKTTEANAWTSGVKSAVRPSACPVKGFAIEELNPEVNFRPSYSNGHVDDVEDKTHLLPYLLASRDLSLQQRKRRIYLDLGGNRFTTSCLWMIRNYPLDFTEYHVFEKRGALFRDTFPKKHSPDQEVLPELNLKSRRFPPYGRPPVSNSILDSFQLHETFVSNKDGEGQIDITRFIKSELKATQHDTLIVKMDIEGAEYAILSEWIKDPEMVQIVDELFVEVHYNHTTMTNFKWNSQFAWTRDDATNLFQDLRKAGYFVHAWP